MSSQNTNSKYIDSGLFDALDTIMPSIQRLLDTDGALPADADEQRYNQYINDLKLVKEGLQLFMKGFISQFFYYGFNIQFQSLNEKIMQTINAISKDLNNYPKEMIECANDYYYNVSEELPALGYGGGSRFVWKSVYCASLYKLLRAFNREGVLRFRITQILRLRLTRT